MARGGMGRGAGIPLGERVALMASTSTVHTEPDDDCPALHVWVLQPADGGPPRAGLLLERRPRPAGVGPGWEARVIYVAALEAGTWTTVEQWIRMDALQPVGSEP